jgi:hypothetical protein
MVIVVYSSGLALSGIGKTPLVSNHPDREGFTCPSEVRRQLLRMI